MPSHCSLLLGLRHASDFTYVSPIHPSQQRAWPLLQDTSCLVCALAAPGPAPPEPLYLSMHVSRIAPSTWDCTEIISLLLTWVSV